MVMHYFTLKMGASGMEISTIGIDLAKEVFQIHAVDARGNVVLKKKLKRKEMVAFFANLTPCLIGMEACSSSHYWDGLHQSYVKSQTFIASNQRSL